MLNDFSQVIPKLHDVVVGWGWIGYAETSSDFIPPTAWAPPSNRAEGGHAIQLHPTTSLLYKKRMTFSHPFIMIY